MNYSCGSKLVEASVRDSILRLYSFEFIFDVPFVNDNLITGMYARNFHESVKGFFANF